ncbi:hypothetical protein IAD21_02905 [Abditibacteriota bacterium]|nr:hypothetical protein IAD21_02905 [Abditibacteriota bacterium]
MFSTSASVQSLVPLRARPFPLDCVRLLDGPFKHAQELDRKYLHFLDPDRFLHLFRVNAGLAPKGEIYGGWESRGVAGQTLGHYLSALAQMSAATGDAALHEKLNYIVSELAQCQTANGNGYIGAIPDGARIWSEIGAGDVRASGFDLNGGWVPWYTEHKVFAGLRDAYLVAANEQALNVLLGLCDWAVTVTANLSEADWQAMLRCEHGGMNEVLADVYALTGEEKYLELAQKFYHRAVLEPLAEGRDDLDGKHANTQIPKVIGLARLYELTGDESLARSAKFFWENVTNERSYVIGGNSDREHFFPPSETPAHLSGETAETCNTYNLLKLSAHLFAWQQDARYFDFYERAQWNHILGSIDHEGCGCGGFNYLNPLEGGHFKTYSHPTDAFWCCVGTGLENHARAGENIFSRGDGELWLNSFIACELDWREARVQITQETRFPNENTTTLRFGCEQPTMFTLHLRHPHWSKTLRVELNGETVNLASTPGSHATIEREWEDGDVLMLQLEPQFALESLRGSGDKAAFVYGPIVLAGDLGHEGMDGLDLYAREQLQFLHLPRPELPVVISDESPLSNLEQRGDNLVLHARSSDGGQAVEVPMMPYYLAHHRRYMVYFGVYNSASWARYEAHQRADEERRRDEALRTLDSYHPGEQQSEVDHELQSEGARTGENYADVWRDAFDGGFFSIALRVASNEANELRVRYWGSDANRTFDIFVNDDLLATQELVGKPVNAFFEASYPLPLTLTQDQTRVRVRFQARSGDIAGGIYGARMLRASTTP